MKKKCKECNEELEAIGNRKYCSNTCFIKSRTKYSRLRAKEWRKNNKQDRKYRKDKDKEIARRFFLNNKKKLAQSIKMPKEQICQECRVELAKQKHHEDYSKPLEVKFVCIGCHRKLNILRRKREVGTLNA